MIRFLPEVARKYFFKIKQSSLITPRHRLLGHPCYMTANLYGLQTG